MPSFHAFRVFRNEQDGQANEKPDQSTRRGERNRDLEIATATGTTKAWDVAISKSRFPSYSIPTRRSRILQSFPAAAFPVPRNRRAPSFLLSENLSRAFALPRIRRAPSFPLSESLSRALTKAPFTNSLL